MTFVEKAIERLNKLIEQSAENSDEQIDYIVMKQALEKQVGREPKIINYGTNVCPECQCTLFRCESYCPDCGQKLNWGDE